MNGPKEQGTFRGYSLHISSQQVEALLIIERLTYDEKK